MGCSLSHEVVLRHVPSTLVVYGSEQTQNSGAPMLWASKIETYRKGTSLLTPLTVINNSKVPVTSGDFKSVPPTESVEVPLWFLQQRAMRSESEVVASTREIP